MLHIGITTPTMSWEKRKPDPSGARPLPLLRSSLCLICFYLLTYTTAPVVAARAGDTGTSNTFADFVKHLVNAEADDFHAAGERLKFLQKVTTNLEKMCASMRADEEDAHGPGGLTLKMQKPASSPGAKPSPDFGDLNWEKSQPLRDCWGNPACRKFLEDVLGFVKIEPTPCPTAGGTPCPPAVSSTPCRATSGCADQGPPGLHDLPASGSSGSTPGSTSSASMTSARWHSVAKAQVVGLSRPRLHSPAAFRGAKECSANREPCRPTLGILETRARRQGGRKCRKCGSEGP
ncbi:unnamed protein product [Amoebophrya sp. A120]|nr:unnamed protein product [Amoebophrya sp. A120]|eukprot:GSA120T00004283001.1